MVKTPLSFVKDQPHFDNQEKALAPPTGFVVLDFVPSAAFDAAQSLLLSFPSAEPEPLVSKLALLLPSVKNLDCPVVAPGLVALPAPVAENVLDTGFVGRRTLIPCSRRW
jgi:hypothetical protein